MSDGGHNATVHQAVAEYERIFGARPEACGVSPGRVEILGNHTDYNGGCVLTAAIDRYLAVVGSACAGEIARVHSIHRNETAEFSVRQPEPRTPRSWIDYVQGVVTVLRPPGRALPAFQAVIAGDLPVGAGLSSSAALDVATAELLRCLASIELPSWELAGLLLRADNEFVGVPCGILDQFSCIHGRADHLMHLDCASLKHELLSLGEHAPAIVLCDPRQPRSLAAGQYSDRRVECETAAKLLAGLLGRPVVHLCEVSCAELATVESKLPEVLVRRARHIIGEHERVGRARSALHAGRWTDLGGLFAASQESSRVNFENSTPELDLLCRLASAQPSCLGARLCGGGWGGHTINLVVSDAVESFRTAMMEGFHEQTGRPLLVHVCRAADGAMHLRL